MKNAKIGTRLTSGFCVLLLMMVIIAGVSYYNVSRLDGEIGSLVKDKWVKSQLVNDMIARMDGVFISSQAMALTTSRAVIKKEDEKIAGFAEKISKDLERLDTLILSETGKKLLAAVKSSRDLYKYESEVYRDLIRSGKQKQALLQLHGPLTDKKLEFNRVSSELERFQDSEVDRIGTESGKVATMTNIVTVVMTLFAVIVGFFISLYLSKSIIDPLKSCVEAAEKIAVGITDLALDTSAHDETGALQKSMQRMVNSIRKVITDGKILVAAAVDGNLSIRVDTAGHQGDFRVIVQGFNDTLDAVITPVNEVRSIMESMAGGNLSRRMTGEVRGEFAVLKESLNNSMRVIAVTIGNVTQNAGQVASASAQTSNAVGQISDGSQNQLHAIGQVAAAIRQTAASIADVSRNTEEASRRAKDSVVIVNEGQVKMAQMVDVVNNIASNSVKINKITDVIEKIANKTNLLSLNAAIEAARAGEHGRGFAVVAEEVGKLAANAAESTQEIVALVNQAVKEANHAVSTVNEVSGGMKKISDGALQTEAMLQRISAALEEQNAAVQEINGNIVSLNKVAESNAAASEEITATVVELARLADNTRKEAEQFRV